MKRSIWFRGTTAIVLVGLIISACSAAGTTPGASTRADTPAPSTLAQASGIDATGVPTTLDPCQIVTAQEASQLSGGSFGAGVESTTEGGGKMCTYGGQTTNVFMVIVGQAPDVATAQAQMAQAENDLKSQASGSPVQTTQLSGIGDAAVSLSMSETVGGETINGSAIYVLKGTIFFGFSDIKVGSAAPAGAAMQAQAQTVLGRLP